MFEHKEKEKEQKSEIRKQHMQVKIWEKGSEETIRQKLRKILNNSRVEDETLDESVEHNSSLIHGAAKSAIKRRVRYKEPVRKFVEKRKEMFLYQLNINEKREQIKEFEELSHLQEISLQQSMQMLEKDATTFQKYVEQNKNVTVSALRLAEDETRIKQKLNTDIKLNIEKVNNMISLNTKKLEQLEKLFAYKVFLDRLTPEEFFTHESNVEIQRKTPPYGKARRDTENDSLILDEKLYNLSLPQELTVFLKQENTSSYKMFFQKPKQLQGMFESLEEENLFSMKHIQEIEQNLENFKHTFEKKKVKLLEQEQILQKNKQEMIRNLKHKQRELQSMKNTTTDSFTEKLSRRMEKEIRQTFTMNEIAGEVKANENERTGLEMLKDIERKLETLVKGLAVFAPQKVYEAFKRRAAKRREMAAANKKMTNDVQRKLRLEGNLGRLEGNKRHGRPTMAKSFLKRDEKQEEVRNIEKPEDIERKLYFTVRFHN